MPPIYFQKPEAALKRAEELIKVGKEADALETLHDTIKVRRLFFNNSILVSSFQTMDGGPSGHYVQAPETLCPSQEASCR